MLDPIDATTIFIKGEPAVRDLADPAGCGPAAARERYLPPLLDERHTAHADAGSTLNDAHPPAVATTSLGEAAVAATNFAVADDGAYETILI